MSLTLALDDLLDYSDHERGKWQAWVAADPTRLRLPVQGSGRFPTIGALLDHIFLVERRHLARLEGSTPPESTGVPQDDGPELFEYAALVRADLRRFLDDLDDERASEVISFKAASGDFTISRRRLLTHLVVHEARHLAQLALAARLAGVEPPGEHDLLYCKEGVRAR